jgi:hypothetical protein
MLATALTCLAAGALTACGDDPPLVLPTPTATTQQADRDQLAGLAAAAKDKRYVATYMLATAKRADRTVTVAVATDGSWVVAIPGGALGGLADVAMFTSAAGSFQCALGPAAGTADSRPDVLPLPPGCAPVGRLTAATDPQVQHTFTDWIDPLVDRQTALSVAAAPLLPGARGSCYSVESNSAALAPPVDPGIYCYERDGVLTAAKVSFGTLTLVGAVADAPPSVTMPGPVVDRPPLAMTAPPLPAGIPRA